MNATAVTFAGVSNNEQNNRSKPLKHLELLAKGDSQKVIKRSRKRTSAIDSPSDLLLDTSKDALLSIADDDHRECYFMVNERVYEMRFQHSNETFRYFYDKKKTFKKALELFNRTHCHLIDGAWISQNYFFECKGPIRVVQRMCTRCRDCDKPKTKTDLYYVNMVEKNRRQRTIYCHGCMGKVLQQEVGTNTNIIEQKLFKLRLQQKPGVYVITDGR